MKVAGFDWDDGNWPKCGKHGVSRDDIEHVLTNMTFRIPDPHPGEVRFRTAGRTLDGRVVFIVFMHRSHDEKLYLRPISARFMHAKEIAHYEHIEKTMAKPADR